MSSHQKSSPSARSSGIASSSNIPMDTSADESTPQPQGNEASLSMGDLSGALPKAAPTNPPPSSVRAPQEKASLKDRMRAMMNQETARIEQETLVAAAAERERRQKELAASNKRERPASPMNIEPSSQKKSKPAAPRLDLKAIHSKPPSAKCCLKIGEAESIGSFKAINGYKVGVKVDGGACGDPKFVLEFRTNKPGKTHKPLSSKVEDTEAFEFEYRPGVQQAPRGQEGQQTFPWQIEKCQAQRLQDLKTLTLEQQRVWNETFEGLRPKLIQLQLIANGHTTIGGPKAATWKIHEPKVFKALRQSGKLTYAVSAIFLIPTIKKGREWMESCLQPFLTAFKHRLPVRHQYFKNGTPNLILDCPKIKDIADQAYCVWPKVSMNDGTGRKVEDKSGNPVAFRKIPKQLFWVTAEDFEIFASMHVIREHQYEEGQTINLQFRNSHAFVQRLPSTFVLDESDPITVPKEQYDPRNRDIKDCFIAYIISPVKDGIKETVPGEGTVVKVEFGTPDDKKNTWEGTVIKRDFLDMKRVGADFAVLIRKPWNSTKRVRVSNVVKEPEPKELQRVRVKVELSSEAAKRQLKAVNDLLLSERPEVKRLLKVLRRKIGEEPGPGDVPITVDLTGGPDKDPRKKEIFHRELQRIRLAGRNNKEQMEALTDLEHVKEGVLIVKGPPGTAKTTNLTQSVWLMTRVGHKVAVIASTNVALDHVTTLLIRGCPEDLGDRKVLRLETNSMEELAILRGASLEMEGLDPRELPKWEDEATMQSNLVDEDPAHQLTFEKYEIAFSESAELMKKYFEQTRNVKEAYRLTREAARRDRVQNVPLATTLNYQIWERTEEDKKEAIAECAREYEKCRENFPNLDDFTQQSKHIHSAEEQNPSFRFTQFRAYFINQDGRVHGRVRKEFKLLWAEVARRVIEDVHVLVISANNAGSDWASLGFNPSVIYFDEAGQTTMAEFCVPLTAYPSWQAAIMYGDTEQLQPPVMSARFNEFVENAKTSPMAVLVMKNHKHIQFAEQFRMDPEISQFPNERFYDGMLRNHSCTKLDETGIKANIRDMTRKRYGLTLENGEGPLYWVRNVVNSVARHEENGSSLQNYANVNAVKATVQDYLDVGVKPEQITILPFYRRQAKFVIERVRNIELPNGVVIDKVYNEVTTVDAYQGKENEVIILDIVAANPNAASDGLGLNMDEGVDEDTAADHIRTGDRRFDHFSHYSKEKHRINVGLTRGRASVCLIIQASGALQTRRWRKDLTRDLSDLSALVTNAIERRVIYEDLDSLDDHPDALLAARGFNNLQLEEKG